MTTQPIEYERPTWREVNIDLLAVKMYGAHTASLWGVELQLGTATPENQSAWLAAAEAAVDELIDRPERDFQAQCDAVLNRPAHVGSWSPVAADDWLPEHA